MSASSASRRSIVQVRAHLAKDVLFADEDRVQLAEIVMLAQLEQATAHVVQRAVLATLRFGMAEVGLPKQCLFRRGSARCAPRLDDFARLGRTVRNSVM